MAKPPSVRARRSFNKGTKRGRKIAGAGGSLFGGLAGTFFGIFDGAREIIVELFPEEEDDEEEEEEEEAQPAPRPSSPGQIVTLPPQAVSGQYAGSAVQ